VSNTKLSFYEIVRNICTKIRKTREIGFRSKYSYFFQERWFFFQDGDVDIAMCISITGAEIVYLNDNPVSKNALLKTNGREHVFTHDGKEYELSLSVTSVAFRAFYECTLKVNGELHSNQKKSYSPKSVSALERLAFYGFFFVACVMLGLAIVLLKAL